MLGGDELEWCDGAPLTGAASASVSCLQKTSLQAAGQRPLLQQDTGDQRLTDGCPTAASAGPSRDVTACIFTFGPPDLPVWAVCSHTLVVEVPTAGGRSMKPPWLSSNHQNYPGTYTFCLYATVDVAQRSSSA